MGKCFTLAIHCVTTYNRDMSSTPLREWLDAHPDKTLTDLMYATRISWRTLTRLQAGKKVGLANAMRIARVTGIAVWRLTDEFVDPVGLDMSPPPQSRRIRKSA